MTSDNAANLSALSNLVMAVAATVAVLYGSYQVFLQGAGHRREGERMKSSAEAIWRQYEILCMQYPYFACPELSKLMIERHTFDDDEYKFISYEYFVSFLAYACEEIERVYGEQEDWLVAIFDELDWHYDYLTSKYYEEYLPNNSEVIRDIIQKMKDRGHRRHQMCDSD